MQTLAMANVPWYFSKEEQCYRVRPGFKFPGIDPSAQTSAGSRDRSRIIAAASKVIEDGEQFLKGLREFCEVLRTMPENHD